MDLVSTMFPDLKRNPDQEAEMETVIPVIMNYVKDAIERKICEDPGILDDAREYDDMIGRAIDAAPMSPEYFEEVAERVLSGSVLDIMCVLLGFTAPPGPEPWNTRPAAPSSMMPS